MVVNLFYRYLILAHRLEFQTKEIYIINRNIDNSPKSVLINKYLLKYRKIQVKKIKKELFYLFSQCEEAEEEAEVILENFKNDMEHINDNIIFSKQKKKLAKKIEMLFSAQENYGTCLDLRFLSTYYHLEYDEVLGKVSSFELTITDSFMFLFALLHLRHYLKRFIYKSRPDISHKKIHKLLYCAEYEEKEHDVFKKKVFCIFCAKEISKSVFEYHIAGKKHVRKKSAFLTDNNQNLESSNFTKKKCLEYFLKQKRESIEVKKKYINKLDAQVKLLLTLLEEELRLAVSIEGTESAMKIRREKKIYNTKIYRDGKGNPVPYWLYNQRGLNVKFECEVCDNLAFKGRKDFENHFLMDKHQEALEKLGIQSGFEKYFGISKKSNALKLKEKMLREN